MSGIVSIRVEVPRPRLIQEGVPAGIHGSIEPHQLGPVDDIVR
jgi:hypothetical protein